MKNNDSIVSIKKSVSIGVQIGTKNFIIPAIDALVANQPEFMPAWILAKGFYGSLFDAKQEEINEFVLYIENNIDVFTKTVVNTKDFRDGFIITFEQYIKQRNEEKRRIIQSIFLGFTKTNHKKNFELERFFDLLNKMSDFQFHVLREVELKTYITIESNEREDDDSDYADLKYLEYLGVLYCDKESTIDSDISNVTEDGYGDVDSTLTERETFYLSVFGDDFVRFITS